MSEVREEVTSPDGSAKAKALTPFSLVYDRIMNHPEGERIFECIQCGTCGGACPVSFAMDRTPRQVINLVRSGRVDEALHSESIWICTSCYSCTVHCPAGIKITEVMYALKAASTELGIHHENAVGPIFARAFASQLESGGRVNEVRVILSVAFRKPRLLLPLGPRTYIRLFRAGRVKLKTEKIKRSEELRRMNDWIIEGKVFGGRKNRP